MIIAKGFGMSEVKIWRSKIAPTCRGAIFRAKRWFYATFYSRIGDEGRRERSRENWVKLARMLVERSNEEQVSDKAARIIIYYTEEGGVFTPIRAQIEVYELKLLKTIDISAE
ncbi:MAG: hypothetical protein DRJ56_03460 [Thermoprotei archaeon]|nr:MAG: hypothetical protein DRJ56_03460 [Thermoprotei archaeon]